MRKRKPSKEPPVVVRLELRDGTPYGSELVRGPLPEVIIWTPASGGEAFVRVPRTRRYRQALTIRSQIKLGPDFKADASFHDGMCISLGDRY